MKELKEAPRSMLKFKGSPSDVGAQIWERMCNPAVRAVVLDPFGGSGTTGVAAQNLGRDCICIERDAQHVETARRRLTTEGQTSLIDG